MNAEAFAEKLRPRPALEALVAEYGLFRVLSAALATAISRNKRRPIRPHELSDHLRRDIGLGPLTARRKG